MEEHSSTPRKLAEKVNTIILSGGGIKGGSYIGCFKALFEKIDRKQITHYIGCSIGGIFSTLLSINYSLEELELLFYKYNFGRFIHEFDLDNFICEKGMSQGEDVKQFFIELLNLKISYDGHNYTLTGSEENGAHNITFIELYNLTKIKITLTVTNYLLQEVEYWSHESTPDRLVIDGLIATSRVPIFFTPYKCHNSIYLDGGIINNFPINIMPIEEIESCIGILLTDKKDMNKIAELLHIEGKIITYIISLILLSFESKKNLIPTLYKKRILEIENSSIDFLDFSINDEAKKSMIDRAYIATNKFINSTF